ncbi:unnamed protein product [Paramecium primaurelia]|uniref:Uncharacterized protein n=1 Tax=Paramecium primaurelia TaxID=5886 RepID=A0A8S1NH74_PARPR|nr:unnamed protein product [Paramecium primaurelia]
MKKKIQSFKIMNKFVYIILGCLVLTLLTQFFQLNYRVFMANLCLMSTTKLLKLNFKCIINYQMKCNILLYHDGIRSASKVIIKYSLIKQLNIPQSYENIANCINNEYMKENPKIRIQESSHYYN